ncbi:MAG: hypothetical protein QXT47_05390 [Desulfurococcaceae archaeon]
MLKCSKCGFTGNRDVIACINLFYRYSRCGVFRVALNALHHPISNDGQCPEVGLEP